MKNFFLLIFLFFFAFSYSQVNQSVLGKWNGNLDVVSTQLPLIFHIKIDDNKFCIALWILQAKKHIIFQ